MTKSEFKERWEKEDGGGITFDDIANCAKEWGLYTTPRIHKINTVANRVLEATGCEKYFDED